MLPTDLKDAIAISAETPKDLLSIEREAMTRDIEQYGQDMWRTGEVQFFTLAFMFHSCRFSF